MYVLKWEKIRMLWQHVSYVGWEFAWNMQSMRKRLFGKVTIP